MKVVDILVIKGTDISKWQGSVDFVKMKQMGVEFVIIRAGYGETEDPMFTAYINAALMAGLAVGVYWFLYASENAGAKKNANKFEQVIKPYKDKITCGVWADWEYDSDKKAGAMTAARRSDLVDTFWQITAARQAYMPIRITYNLSLHRSWSPNIHCGMRAMVRRWDQKHTRAEMESPIYGSIAARRQERITE